MEIRKRKPLSDITSTLRKLVSNSDSNSTLKPPISNFKSSSTSRNWNPYLDPSPTLIRTDTGSDTRIGSSNVDSALNARTVRFQTLKRPVNSIASLGGRGSNDVVYRGRQIPDKLKKQREVAAVTDSSTPVVKKNDKGKSIAIPPSPPLPGDKKTTGNVISERFCSPEKMVQNGSSQKMKEFGKGILNLSSCSNGKIENGNTVLNYLSCSKEKIEERGKVFTSPSNCSYDQIKDKGKVIVGLSGSSIQKAKDVGKATNYSSFLVEKTKGKEKLLNPFGGKTRDKGKAICHPPNMIGITHKGLSATVAVNCRQPGRNLEKRKGDAGASSYPPMRKTKNIENDFEEAGFLKSSKSLTAVPPKFRKRSCHEPTSADESCLPPNFIKQQRAYFKEVDDFVLEEEEISANELD